MNEDEILKKIEEILKKTLYITVDIDPAKSLLSEKILDSIDWIKFLTIVEEKFDITIKEEEAVKYQIGFVNNLIKLISEKIK